MLSLPAKCNLKLASLTYDQDYQFNFNYALLNQYSCVRAIDLEKTQHTVC